MDQVRVGVVGLGLIAQAVHLPNLDLLRDRLRVTHVCDASPSLTDHVVARLPGSVAASIDWHDLVADPEVDAVLVLTPGDHSQVAEGALRAGKHVFCEKPLAYTVAECRLLGELARTQGLVLQVGYMKMYDPVLERARSELATLGEIRVVRITVLHPTDEVQVEHLAIASFADAARDVVSQAVAYSTDSVSRALGASAPVGARTLYENVLLGSVVHQTALLRALGLGLPETYGFVSVDPPLSDDTPRQPPRLTAVGLLPDNVELHLAWNWVPVHPEYVETVEVIASRGHLMLDLPGPYLPAHRTRLRVSTVAGAERCDATYVAGHTTGFVRELEAFAASVRGGAPPRSDAEGAAADTAALQRLLATAAAREGIPLDVEAAHLQGAAT